MRLCQKGTEQLKNISTGYIHWFLLISANLFLKALARRERAGRYEVPSEGIYSTHPVAVEIQTGKVKGEGS